MYQPSPYTLYCKFCGFWSSPSNILCPRKRCALTGKTKEIILRDKLFQILNKKNEAQQIKGYARRAAYTISKEWKDRVIEIQENKCLYCRKVFGSFFDNGVELKEIKIVWDHRVPLSKGGSNKAENFRACCQFCNLFKGSKTFDSIEEIIFHVKQKWTDYCLRVVQKRSQKS